ncbi:hypothetical protein KR074_006312, partial [Drosophila pseudoananassae]
LFVKLVSDTCHRDPTKDRSGPKLIELVRDSFTNVRVTGSIAPDEHLDIKEILCRWIGMNFTVIFTTGGTGFGPRDITPEATKPVIDRECPHLAALIAQESIKKTKFAALSRGICGIASNSLIINLPGSEKAVIECFATVRDLLPHAIHLITNDLVLVKSAHSEMQNPSPVSVSSAGGHVCPHKTGNGTDTDRNSPFPMLPVEDVLALICKHIDRSVNLKKLLWEKTSPVNIPPFRASIKDGYAMKSTGFSGTKRVIGFIAAGDVPNSTPLAEDECFKINTGAPVPLEADCVVQVEDTDLLERDTYGNETLVNIKVEPTAGLDIRPVGHDLSTKSLIFPAMDPSPVVIKSLLASVGHCAAIRKPKIAIVSTGSELISPNDLPRLGKIYDSNTTMLEELLQYFGFECMKSTILSDNFDETKETLSNLFDVMDFVICSGGVSMGDKDYIKPILDELNFEIHCGRVNMKPGKPLTFASRPGKYFFGLPGNPVSAFVTFHLFALPAIRWAAGWEFDRCCLPKIKLELLNDIDLDSRPEYVRASVISKQGVLYASVNGDQISSRLQSIAGADVLINLPGATKSRAKARAGESYLASVLRYDFISKYE